MSRPLSRARLDELACWAATTAAAAHAGTHDLDDIDAINLIRASDAVRELVDARERILRLEHDLSELRVFAVEVIMAAGDTGRRPGRVVASINAAIDKAELRGRNRTSEKRTRIRKGD